MKFFSIHTSLMISTFTLEELLAGCLIIILMFIVVLRINTKRLRNAKLELERIVEERTATLKHKEQEITDSIKYALRIQLSIIPTQQRVKSLLPKSMVYYRPKDIVSGDFYWIENIDDEVLFAAVDCTGHGVPGAMMSVIGLKSLSQAVQDKRISVPADILQYLDIAVNDTLRQSYDPSAVKDGMDLALCNINYKTLMLQYAGAFNSLVLIRKNIASTYTVTNDRETFYGSDMLEIKSDKCPIGSNPDGVADIFTNHRVQLQKDDCIYIYTDGYADQFGGPKGKKFKYNQLKDVLISLAGLPIDEHYAVLDKTFNNWRGSQEQVDDVLVIGVKI
ncbi:MAG: SpoIIE family protein phosphatase [Bacteroidetes bacterium]|nr:SpoIIE family protein phosphatase [Bacteroidota bacterium]